MVTVPGYDASKGGSFLTVGPPTPWRRPEVPFMLDADCAGPVSYRRHLEAPSGLDLVAWAAFADQHAGNHHSLPQSSGRLVVASASGTAIGYGIAVPLDVAGDLWYLDTVAVVPQRQGEGIGTQLIIEVARWLHQKGVRHIQAQPLHGDDQDKRARWIRDVGFIDRGEGPTAAVAYIASLRLQRTTEDAP